MGIIINIKGKRGFAQLRIRIHDQKDVVASLRLFDSHEAPPKNMGLVYSTSFSSDSGEPLGYPLFKKNKKK